MLECRLEVFITIFHLSNSINIIFKLFQLSLPCCCIQSSRNDLRFLCLILNQELICPVDFLVLTTFIIILVANSIMWINLLKCISIFIWQCLFVLGLVMLVNNFNLIASHINFLALYYFTTWLPQIIRVSVPLHKVSTILLESKAGQSLLVLKHLTGIVLLRWILLIKWVLFMLNCTSIN